MKKTLEEIKSNFLEELKKADSKLSLEDIFREYIGRKGALTGVLRSLKDIPAKKRGQIGREANQLKKFIQDKIDEAEKNLKEKNYSRRKNIDVTAPGRRREAGHLHPLTLITRRAVDIFSSMGFGVVEGPDIEDEYYNFDALNIPPDHPAKDLWDTFWLRSNQGARSDDRANIGARKRFLLRTHTSPVQIRYMEKNNPPFRIIVPGRAYRYEATDASHDIQFHQLEGLLVDEEVSVANFKAVIEDFFHQFFFKEASIRLRPSYFPFVEPGFEVDVTCVNCSGGGKGCSVCRGGGWLEIAGAGMVHPNVFKSAGYVPDNWRGFAFGMGLDRLAMIKYRIDDIRLFSSGDLRFIEQF